MKNRSARIVDRRGVLMLCVVAFAMCLASPVHAATQAANAAAWTTDAATQTADMATQVAGMTMQLADASPAESWHPVSLTVRRLSDDKILQNPIFGCWRFSEGEEYEVRIDYSFRDQLKDYDKIGVSMEYPKNVDILKADRFYLTFYDESYRVIGGASVEAEPSWHSYSLKLTNSVRLYTNNTGSDGRLVGNSIFQPFETLWLNPEDWAQGHLTFAVQEVGVLSPAQVAVDCALGGILLCLVVMLAHKIMKWAQR